jgi:hypothetical protein
MTKVILMMTFVIFSIRRNCGMMERAKEVAVMQDERRRFPRVDTHIVIKLVNRFTQTEHLGYIENISEGGLGVAALDTFAAGSQFGTVFFLPENSRKLTPQAYIVHIRKGTELAQYYGLCFRSLSETEQNAIADFTRQEMM